MKILVVDDSAAMRVMVKRMLKKVGFGDCQIEEACDGEQGLKRILEDRPDLVLSDWNMPNMTGIEMLKALKEENVNPPFGFVTTESTAEMKQLADQYGARFMIAKPLTAEAFEKALEKYRP